MAIFGERGAYDAPSMSFVCFVQPRTAFDYLLWHSFQVGALVHMKTKIKIKTRARRPGASLAIILIPPV